jgi:hypothetical protein
MATRDERKQTSDDASKRFLKASEPESHHYSGISVEGTCLLAMRCPAYRGHDSYPGFRTELENRVGDVKGKGSSAYHTRPKVPMHRSGAHCFVVAKKRGNARRAKGAGHSHRAGSTGNRMNSLS